MAVDVDDLVRLQQAHHQRLIGVQETTADLVGQAWDAYAGLDDIAAAQFTSAASVVVEAGTTQTSTLAVAYMDANDAVGGFDAAQKLLPGRPDIRNGIPTQDIYQRSIAQARRMVAGGAPHDAALAAGRARAVQTAKTDISLANRAEMARGGPARPWVVGYRRVLTGRSCAFCATASTQRYRGAGLLPLHPGCDCDVAEIIGTADPGRVINRELLDELKRVSEETSVGNAEERQTPYLVDADGKILRADIHQPGPDAPAGTQPSITPGPPVRVQVVDHGELGPTLTDAKHDTASVPDPTPEPHSPTIGQRPAPLNQSQYEALQPNADRFNKQRDRQAVKQLRSTPEGAALQETLAQWQFSHASNVTRIRTNVAKRLRGEKMTDAAAAKADRLIDAIRNSPLEAPELYRGMRIPGTTQEVLDKFRGQSTLDINVSSFSSRQGAAANFMVNTEGQAVGRGKATGVFMIVERSPAVKALPIENISGGAGIWQEREWISGGRYELISAGANKDGDVIVRLRQVAALGD